MHASQKYLALSDSAKAAHKLVSAASSPESILPTLPAVKDTQLSQAEINDRIREGNVLHPACRTMDLLKRNTVMRFVC